MRMKHGRKRIKELNLLDNFLFFEAVSGEQGEWFCRMLIRTICGKEPEDIKIRPQSIIQGAETTWHGIRMDLYIQEKITRCTYDFEPDRYTDGEILPRRNRYYRALLDSRLLECGEDYSKLPDMWTVFIMSKDPFGKGRMCYTVKNVVIEDTTIRYEDGAVSLFLYTKGDSEGNEKLSQLMAYFEKSVAENATTEELQRLHNYVTEIKQRKEVGVRYMKTWDFERMWREEGREEGCQQARTAIYQAILLTLSRKGNVSGRLRQQIEEQKDLNVLNQWFCFALDAKAVEDFNDKIEKQGF